MFDKLKQLNQLNQLKKQASQLKQELAQETACGEALNGQIKITLNGNQEIKNIEIDNSLLSSDQKEKLEQGLKEAFKKAMKEVKMIMVRKMQSGKMNLPGIS